MVVIPIFADDLEKAKEFYCEKLKFEIYGSVNDSGFFIKNNIFFAKDESTNTVFSIRKPKEIGFAKTMNKSGYWINFEKFNVRGLYSEIIDTITSFDGPVEEMPNENYYGMYECPGGCYLTVNDPFGNYLVFNEW